MLKRRLITETFREKMAVQRKAGTRRPRLGQERKRTLYCVILFVPRLSPMHSNTGAVSLSSEQSGLQVGNNEIINFAISFCSPNLNPSQRETNSIC